jgi:N-methylhydantoinase A
MNRIDPDYFLGGAMKLDREGARIAIKEKIADPMGMKVEEAAEAICQIVDGQMETLLERTIARKGIDPSKFVLFAFGGAGPAHAAGYSENIPFPKVIIPTNASTFCAFGAATADVKHRYEASCFVSFHDIPYNPINLRFDLEKIILEQFPSRILDRINDVFEDLDNRITNEMEAEGFTSNKVTRKYEVLARYIGQLWELRAPVNVNHISTATDLGAILNSFSQRYEAEYGREAMIPSAGVEIISLGAEGTAPAVKPKLIPRGFVGKDPSAALKSERQVYFKGKWVKTSIYDYTKLNVGNIIEGPGIIEMADTTIVIPQGRRGTIDEYLHIVMERT